LASSLQALGAKEVAQGLLNNVSLHTLNLAWNGLEDAGCTAIANTLHQNMGLQVRPPIIHSFIHLKLHGHRASQGQ